MSVEPHGQEEQTVEAADTASAPEVTVEKSSSPGASLFDDLKSGGGESVPENLPEQKPAEPQDAEPVAQEAAPVEETPWWQQELPQLGFENVESEEDARRRLIEAYRQQQSQFEQTKPLADYGKQYLALMRDPVFAQALAERQAPQQPTEQQPAQSSWWTAPEIDQRWLEKYRVSKVDPVTGQEQVVWREDTPAEVREKAEAWAEHIQDWQQKLIYEPHKVLPQIIEEITRPLIEQHFQTVHQTQEVGQFINQVAQEHADVLYERDPLTGRPAVDPSTGGLRFSEQGQQMVHTAQALVDRGLDVREAWQIAADRAELARLRNKTQGVTAAQQAQQVNQQKKQELLQRNVAGAAAPIPSRGGSFPEPHQAQQQAQNSNLSAGRQLIGLLQGSGNF